MTNVLCPCGSEESYANCCEIFLRQERTPATPEELMRSRYTAYTQANMEYITRTMASPAADDFDVENTRTWAQRVEWIKLEVVETAIEGSKGFVEFLAYYFENKKKHVIHELSEFHMIDGAWYYMDGRSPKRQPIVSESATKRNDPCPCASGKKYKKCCGGVS